MAATMNLTQWAERYGAGRVRFPGGNPHVCAIIHGIGPADPGWRDLYNLSDYTVSTVTGGSVWLCPGSARPAQSADSLSDRITAAIKAAPDGLTTRQVGAAVGVPCSCMLERLRRLSRIVKRPTLSGSGQVWIIR